MNTSSLIQRVVPLALSALLLVGSATAEEVPGTQGKHRNHYSPNSGLIATVYFGWYFCDGPPRGGHGPYVCAFPRPYFGTISLYTPSGHFVASTRTVDFGIAVVNVQPGDYVVRPDDPKLTSYAWTVTIPRRDFLLTDLVLPWNADQ